MNLLITALTISTLCSVGLAMACVYLIRLNKNSEATYRERLSLAMNEKGQCEQYIHKLLATLNSCVGGISKRVHENIEIVESISKHAPDLFKQDKSLAYNLHASSQFLMEIFKVAENGIHSTNRDRISHMIDRGELDVYKAIYESPDLPIPRSVGV